MATIQFNITQSTGSLGLFFGLFHRSSSYTSTVNYTVSGGYGSITTLTVTSDGYLQCGEISANKSGKPISLTYPYSG